MVATKHCVNMCQGLREWDRILTVKYLSINDRLQRGKNTFILEKSGRLHLDQVVKLRFPSNGQIMCPSMGGTGRDDILAKNV